MFSVICIIEAAASTVSDIGPGLPERCAPLSSATKEKRMRPRYERATPLLPVGSPTTRAAGSWSGIRKRAPRESISSPTAATNVMRQSSGTSTAPPPTARAQQGLFASTEPRPSILSSLTKSLGPPGTVSIWLSSTSSLSPFPRVAITEPAPSRCEVSQPKRGRRSASIRAASSSWPVGLGTATISTRSPTDSGRRIYLPSGCVRPAPRCAWMPFIVFSKMSIASRAVSSVTAKEGRKRTTRGPAASESRPFSCSALTIS